MVGYLLSSESTKLLFNPHVKHFSQNWYYGYGWIIDQWNGWPMIWYNGSVDGFMSDISIFPDKNLTVIILSNRVFRPSKVYLDKMRYDIVTSISSL